VGRDIEYDAAGVAELVFGIGGSVAGRRRMALAAMRLDRLLHRIDVVHPDAEMMHADEVLAALVAGVLLIGMPPRCFNTILTASDQSMALHRHPLHHAHLGRRRGYFHHTESSRCA